MRIAFTADLHLTSRVQNPERFIALENLLADLAAHGLDTLVIAGDLFDAVRQNYAEFEQLCRAGKKQQVTIVAIPGNHDPTINNQQIDAPNLKIISQPWIKELDGRTFFFLPYRAGMTMGEAIAPYREQLPAGEWVLVAHGDWAGGLRSANPTEPGVYMPLTRRDIEIYRPARVFLGHIHSPMDTPPVHYVGSPCGLDITETGRRRYLVYNTATDSVEPFFHHTPVYYFNETFIIVPVEDEAAYIRAQITDFQDKWKLTPDEKARTQIRVKVVGYSAGRAALRAVLREALDGFTFYKGREPDISEVFISEDYERHYIADQINQRLKTLSLANGLDEPPAEDILMEALQLVYGR